MNDFIEGASPNFRPDNGGLNSSTLYPVESAKRFWDRVDIKTKEECWLWQGCRNKGGYGYARLNGKRILAHRAAWELHSGQKIPEGLFGCHACDNPPCVNPHHIWIGTNRENVRDAKSKGRLHNQDKTHCKRGHPLSDDNLIITTQGSRSCRVCMAMHRKNHAEQKPRVVDPVKNRERVRQWQLDNPDKAKMRKQKWVEENRQKVREYQREYQRKLRAEKKGKVS